MTSPRCHWATEHALRTQQEHAEKDHERKNDFVGRSNEEARYFLGYAERDDSEHSTDRAADPTQNDACEHRHEKLPSEFRNHHGLDAEQGSAQAAERAGHAPKKDHNPL